MRAMDANTVEIATKWLPNVRVLGELHVGVVTYRTVIRGHLLALTIEEKDTVEKTTLASTISINDKIRASYESMISGPTERALYDDWARLWKDYQDVVAKVLKLSREAAGRLPQEAIDLNREAIKLGQAADAALIKDIQFNNTGAEKETRAASDSYASGLKMLAVILGIAIVSGAAISLYVIRDVASGIASIVKPMQALGRGDLSTDIPHRGEKIEIGMMADALQVFKEALIAKQAADEAVAQDAEAKIERARRVDSITRQFETVIGEIVTTVSSASSQLEASAGSLSSTAERSERLATTVASVSEEATTNVQSVASATEEMASSINEIGRQVQDSARMASEAVGQARSTTDRVSELSKAATRIGDVVELINTIAGQTNLLALNATIEAARAGEAGRGFAVVASEVKALAEQTAKATGEIGQQISGIQAATLDSVNAIKTISGTIERLSEISSAIAAAVEEQGAATQEISRNVQQAAHGTQQVSANITEVQRGAIETGSASSQVLSAAQTLSGDSSRLKQEVGKFLTSVRAA
jgi:methyl-accepting chemotaxis protein